MAEHEESVDDFNARMDALSEGVVVTEVTQEDSLSVESENTEDKTEDTIAKEDIESSDEESDDTFDIENQIPENDDVKDDNDSVEDAFVDEIKVNNDTIVADETETIEDNSDEDKTGDEWVSNKVLESFGIESADDLKNVMRTLKLSKQESKDNQANLDLGKIIAKTELTEDDIALMVAIKNGDKDAIIELAQKSNINQEDLDREVKEVDRNIEEFKETDIDKGFNSFLAESKSFGINPSDINDKILKVWDEESILKLVSDKDSRVVVAQHMSDGTYDKVIARKEIMLNKDFSGKLDGINEYDLYSMALRDIRSSEKSERKIETKKTTQSQVDIDSLKRINAEKATREEDQRRADSAKKAKKTAKGASDSSEKTDSREMTNEEFDKYIASM